MFSDATRRSFCKYSYYNFSWISRAFHYSIEVSSCFIFLGCLPVANYSNFFFFFFSFFSPRTHRLLSSCDIFIMNIPRLACGSQYGILVCINTNWPRFVASNLALFKLPRSVLGEKYSYSGNLDRFYSFTEISRDGERRNKKLRK